MTDRIEEDPIRSETSLDRENVNATDANSAFIPVSDFRRNEARPILTEDNRHKSIYHQTSLTKYNQPERRRRRHHRLQNSGELPNTPSKSGLSDETKVSSDLENPTTRIQFLLGDEEQELEDEEHRPHDLFIELNELKSNGEKSIEFSEPTEIGWKETARWVKFEEDVETGGRWSKPHVASLSLHSLLELRNCILNGCVILDMKADQLTTIVDMILDTLIANESLPADKRPLTRNALLLRHIHQHEKEFHRLLQTQACIKPLPFTRSSAELTQNRSQKDVRVPSVEQMASATLTKKLSHQLIPMNTLSPGNQSKTPLHENDDSKNNLPGSESRMKMNVSFLKKVPRNSEATNVLIGSVDFLDAPIYAFVRLAKGVTIPDLLEVPLPIRFLFILIGPSSEHQRHHEIGRSMSTLMSDEIFHEIAYRARDRQDLLAGIDDFLDHVTVLPPSEWDPTTRIEPPKSVPNKEDRLDRNKVNGVAQPSEPTHHEHEVDPTLVMTGKFCGGLIQDIKRKAKFYWSDFTDAFSFQSVAAIIFLYFACLSPIITFGGLLSKATDDNMAAIESLLSGVICGCLFHLFGGQPLAILGSTGPVLVFETIVNTYSRNHGIDYMNFRCWIGLWTTFILIIMVVTDASYLVKYITRFTEESFAALIGIIFIYEAFNKILDVNRHRPVLLQTNRVLPSNCSCLLSNATNRMNSGLTINDCFKSQSYKFNDPACKSLIDKAYIPDVFFFSMLLFISTFTLAYTLKNFKFTQFFPMSVRTKISDFGVVLAIFINVMIDYYVGLDTPKLTVPQKFATTKPNRGWVINPFGKNKPYIWFAAILPALLATILIYMDQHITAVIVNRKENKLKKGGGYHLDLLIVAICIGINSIFGLPWFVAATVLSINHVIALKLESATAAPGEKPKFLGVREQRVTGFVVFLFIGLSVFLTKYLGYIPMPVLYGIFLYMGISSLKEIQLVSRLLLILMPEKYQPDYVYLRYVRTSRVHLFTLIQISCLILLWLIKSIKSISILFPIMVLALVGARKAMDYVFTQQELEYLDDIMPEIVKKEIEEKRNSLKPENTDDAKQTQNSNDEKNAKVFDGNNAGKSLQGNSPANRSNNVMNISEEVGKTYLWKSIAKTKDKGKPVRVKRQPSDDKSIRSTGLKERIRRFSLNFRSSDEDRALVNIENQVLPAIIIEPTNDEEQVRLTDPNKPNDDITM